MIEPRISGFRSTQGSDGASARGPMSVFNRLLVLIAVLLPGSSVAQQLDFSGQIMEMTPASQVLVLNQERLLRDSAVGQQVLENVQLLRSAHQSEGERLELELETEERELAELRQTLDTEEFQERAIAFDAKVVRIRQEHAQKSEALSLQVEDARKEFFANVVPIVAQIMGERGALLVFEQRNVLFTGPGIDITDDVIRRIDNVGPLQ